MRIDLRWISSAAGVVLLSGALLAQVEPDSTSKGAATKTNKHMATGAGGGITALAAGYMIRRKRRLAKAKKLEVR